MEHELLKKKSKKKKSNAEDVNEDFKPRFCCAVFSLKQLQELWSC